jgi:hypothetical protein
VTQHQVGFGEIDRLRLALRRAARHPSRLAAIAGILAAIVVGLIIGLLGPTTVDPDATASVLYFDRMIRGLRLETFLATTPNPLLTLVYGATWTLLGDWRLLTLETLVVFGAAVALGARLAGRIAGVGGAVLAVTALVLWGDLVVEVAHANSLVWALAGWLLAGLALSGQRPRPAIAGVALLLAALCSVETWFLIVPLACAVAADAIRARRAGRPAPGRSLAVAAGIAVLALPLILVHDWLLTGDPLFWTTVAQRYTTIYAPDLTPTSPLVFAGSVLRHAASEPLLVVAGLAGFAILLASGRARIGLAVVLLAAGATGLLFALAARGTYVSNRYYEVPDLALLGGAAVSIPAAVALAGRGLATVTSRASPVGAMLQAIRDLAVPAAIAVLLVWPIAPLGSAVGVTLARTREASAAIAHYLPEVRAALQAAPGPSGVTPDIRRGPVEESPTARVFIPATLRARVALETGVALPALGDLLALALADRVPAGLSTGQLVYHDGSIERNPAVFGPFEVTSPTPMGAVLVTPRIVDGARSVWISSLDRR